MSSNASSSDKRKKNTGGSNTALIIFAIIALIIVVGGGIAVAVITVQMRKKEEERANEVISAPPTNPPPPEDNLTVEELKQSIHVLKQNATDLVMAPFVVWKADYGALDNNPPRAGDVSVEVREKMLGGKELVIEALGDRSFGRYFDPAVGIVKNLQIALAQTGQTQVIIRIPDKASIKLQITPNTTTANLNSPNDEANDKAILLQRVNELKNVVDNLNKTYSDKVIVTRATAEAGTEYVDITSKFAGYFSEADKRTFSFNTPLADLEDNGVTSVTMDVLEVRRGNQSFRLSVVDGSQSSIQVK